MKKMLSIVLCFVIIASIFTFPMPTYAENIATVATTSEIYFDTTGSFSLGETFKVTISVPTIRSVGSGTCKLDFDSLFAFFPDDYPINK